MTARVNVQKTHRAVLRCALNSPKILFESVKQPRFKMGQIPIANLTDTKMFAILDYSHV